MNCVMSSGGGGTRREGATPLMLSLEPQGKLTLLEKQKLKKKGSE